MKKTLKKFLTLAIVGVLSGATTYGTIEYLKNDNNSTITTDQSYFSSSNKNASFTGMNAAALGDNFVKASKTTVPAVVTIKNYGKKTSFNNRRRPSEFDIFEEFFNSPFRGNQRGRRMQPKRPSNMPTSLGSGVIISSDGYIISNNHVVEGANKLEVVLSNKKTYLATLVGTDPNTDISLLKIEEKGLPYLNFANSDNVNVGEWVLAVGNPLGLNSTVTAGIISAKGRGIGILSSNGNATNPIESFLQTDAAINQGNSGGALVNINGDLIGINSAIASTSGYYQGYGFAVPSNLARKIVEDIKKYGLVQRGYLGIGVLDLSDGELVRSYNKQEKTNIKVGSGIFVKEVVKNGGAEDAGLRTGDIITKINHQKIKDYSDLSMMIGSKRPGDRVSVTFTRNGKEEKVSVVLRDKNGKTKTRNRSELTVTEKIGAEFEPLSQRIKTNYGLRSGIVAKNVVPNSEMAQIGVVDNYIIIEVNGKPVNSQKEVEKILKKAKEAQIKYVDEYGRIYTRGFVMPK